MTIPGLLVAVIAGMVPSSRRFTGFLAAFSAAVFTAYATEMWAAEPRVSHNAVSMLDDDADAVRVSDRETTQTQTSTRPTAEATLHALGEAVRTKRLRSRPESIDHVNDTIQIPSSDEAAGDGDAGIPSQHRPSAARPSPPGPLPNGPTGWVAAGTRAKKQPTPRRESLETEAVKPRVRWADARADESKSVRPAANWSASASIRLRGPSGRSNPLRDADGPVQTSPSKTRGANPLRNW
jgi:hypothetical protein